VPFGALRAAQSVRPLRAGRFARPIGATSVIQLLLHASLAIASCHCEERDIDLRDRAPIADECNEQDVRNATYSNDTVQLCVLATFSNVESIGWSPEFVVP